MGELGAPAAMLWIAGHRRVALGAKRLHGFIITCKPLNGRGPETSASPLLPLKVLAALPLWL